MPRLRQLADTADLSAKIQFKVLDGDDGHGDGDRSAAILRRTQNITATLANAGFETYRTTRVFRHAGKHEARHIEWGFDRWYRSDLVLLPRSVNTRQDKFGKGGNIDETEPVHGPLPSPSAQAHLAVDAIEVLLNASNGAQEHLEILEAYMIPKMHYTPDDTHYSYD